jgi:hypothetical protein
MHSGIPLEPAAHGLRSIHGQYSGSPRQGQRVPAHTRTEVNDKAAPESRGLVKRHGF